MLTALERQAYRAWRDRVERDLVEHRRRYAVAEDAIQLLERLDQHDNEVIDRLCFARQDRDWAEDQIAECHFKLESSEASTRILWDPNARDRLVRQDILQNLAPVGAGGVPCS